MTGRNPEGPFCRDCVWSAPIKRGLFSTLDWTFATCLRPQREAWDLVSGEPLRTNLYCANERTNYGPTIDNCGSKGQFFQPRRKAKP